MSCEEPGCGRPGDWAIAGRHFCEEHAKIILEPKPDPRDAALEEAKQPTARLLIENRELRRERDQARAEATCHLTGVEQMERVAIAQRERAEKAERERDEAVAWQAAKQEWIDVATRTLKSFADAEPKLLERAERAEAAAAAMREALSGVVAFIEAATSVRTPISRSALRGIAEVAKRDLSSDDGRALLEERDELRAAARGFLNALLTDQHNAAHARLEAALAGKE